MNRYGFFCFLSLLTICSVCCRTLAPSLQVDSTNVLASPDPLVLKNGDAVTTVSEWENQRRPEILQLFAEHMYGEMPAAPKVTAIVQEEDRGYMGGAATKKRITLSYGPEGTPAIHLLVVVPNRVASLPPVFLGLNFYGNHSVLDDSSIPLTRQWVPERASGVVNNRATEAARGTAAVRWSIADVIERGYASATLYHADVDPDKDDFSDGVHTHISVAGSTERTDSSWGTIAAWAWGLHRAVDYLITDPDIDGSRIAVMGHSRNGKAALLAGAIDERIGLVISNQSGCGGAALSKRKMGETVKAINTRFPHWFNKNFRKYNDNEEMLPLDQHLLIALIAPRPVLVTSARGDEWADPKGEFQALLAVDPVYRLYGKQGLAASEMPPDNSLIGTTSGYHIRPGEHGVGLPDWQVFMDFADRHF